jgi:hypothetical protein
MPDGCSCTEACLFYRDEVADVVEISEFITAARSWRSRALLARGRSLAIEVGGREAAH